MNNENCFGCIQMGYHVRATKQRVSANRLNTSIMQPIGFEASSNIYCKSEYCSQLAFSMNSQQALIHRIAQSTEPTGYMVYQPTGLHEPNTATRLQPTGFQHNKVALVFIHLHSHASSSPGLWTEHTQS